MARDRTPITDLTLLVRTTGNVHGYRAFTEAQQVEAERYASEHGAQVEHLP
ncbi:hypothetical protein [Mycolicibacterium neoaurum]|uniref:hypothetical protein n=1 Tax=Mycolicibacterium neoaurum TaxID=1795 RepID=UPI000AEF0727|nr:hypothetical protein [Mycolicibacterium neoaurum]